MLARAEAARTSTSAARVAIEPLGVVAYDGVGLPMVSGDGRYLAVNAGGVSAVQVYVVGSPLVLRWANAESIVLMHGADEEGFFGRRVGHEGETSCRVRFDGVVEACDGPAFDGRILARIRRAAGGRARDEAVRSLLWGSSEVFFDPVTARMAVWPAEADGPIALAAGSIAGCRAETRAGRAVLLTMLDGLYLQRLIRIDGGWSVEAPVRLLREPWVPRATSDPARPFVLIGPAAGTAEEPHRLQIAAMRLIEGE